MASVDFGDCEITDFSVPMVVLIATSMGLPTRKDPEIYLPSPRQIRLECARIRDGWTQTEREARLGGGSFCRMNDATGEHNHAGGGAPDDRRS